MHDDSGVAHDRFDRFGRLESRMDAVEKRQTRLEDAHSDQERAWYGFPDPTAPNGFSPGIIQRVFDAIAQANAKLESMEQAIANFANGLQCAAKIAMRACWFIACGSAVALASGVAWLVNHWAAVDKLMNAIGKAMQ